MNIKETVVVVRGAGDIATGVIQKLWRSGFKVLALETEQPTAIRRTVSLCMAVTEGVSKVEDMTAYHAVNLRDVERIWAEGNIPILVDPLCRSIEKLEPLCVIDSILAKKNLGTTIDMAPIVLALGPGFTAGEDVHAVIETMRGHNLGRLIFRGSALPNTGTPGELGGQSTLRVIRAPHEGTVRHGCKLGDVLEKGETIFWVNDTPVFAPFTGVVRGLLAEGMTVIEGFKTADIDPRLDTKEICHTISDKARNVGGAALEGLLFLGCQLEEIGTKRLTTLL